MTTRSADAFVSQLTSNLGDLRPHQLCAYFAANGERLIPLYVAFQAREHWGDAGVLTSTLGFIWRALAHTSEVEHREVSERAAAVAFVAPHADDFDSIDVIYAQDACIAVDAALQAWLGKPSAHLAQFMVNPVLAYLCDRDTGVLEPDESFNYIVMRDPLMLSEIEFHSSLLRTINSFVLFDDAALAAIRDLTDKHRPSLRSD
jgi:hypothetical protein